MTRALPIAGALLSILCRDARTQQSPASHFVIMAGTDTVAVEQLTTADRTLTGDLRLIGQQARVHYVIHVTGAGMAERVEVTNDAAGFFSGTIAFDPATLRTARMTSESGAVRLAPAKSYPAIGTSIALMEQIIRATHPAVGDSTHIMTINIRNNVVGTMTIARFAADSVRIDCVGCQRAGVTQQYRFALTGDGRILGGTSKPQDWEILRTPR